MAGKIFSFWSIFEDKRVKIDAQCTLPLEHNDINSIAGSRL